LVIEEAFFFGVKAALEKNCLLRGERSQPEYIQTKNQPWRFEMDSSIAFVLAGILVIFLVIGLFFLANYLMKWMSDKD